MSTQWNAQKFNEIVAEVQKRSVTDEDFRALALKDSSAAIEEVAGEPLPSGAKLRFVNQIEEVVVVLPPPAGGAELTEEQLEQVAGGTAFIGFAAVTIGGVAATIATREAGCM